MNTEPGWLTVPARVWGLAERHPDRIAVVAQDGQWTYAELAARAGTLAAELHRRGVRPADLVGVYLPRRLDAVAALLATWSVGAAQVPVDPSYPSGRREFIVADSGISALVTNAELAGTMRVDTELVLVEDYPTPDPSTGTRSVPAAGLVLPEPGDVAYVTYTSGSTGQPKGVQVEHRNLSTFLGWYGRAAGLTGADRCSNVTSAGFDVTVWEIWGAIANGATVCLCPESARHSAQDTIAWCAESGITVSFLPTALGEHMLRDPNPAWRSLRMLFIGGDRLRIWPPDGLWFTVRNNYGPTECAPAQTSSVIATPAASVDDEPRSGSSMVGEPRPDEPPIGWPVDGTEILLVTEDGAVVPTEDTSTVGEIWITGALVGRGYLNRPRLTTERFVRAPNGARAYRTGDLAHRNTDGRLQFVGRRDDQVKIRGFLVEPGEVDATLRTLDGVADCVTVARPTPEAAGTHELISYVVPLAGQQLDEAQLRKTLGELLPSYQVPERLVELERLPISSHGKIDRAALPDPYQRAALPGAEDPAGPADPTGTVAVLVGMYAEVLGIQPHPDTDFFSAGGHSLQLTMLLGRIAERFGIDLLFRDVFAAATPRLLADLLEASRGSGPRRAAPTTSAPGTTAPGTTSATAERPSLVPLSPAQQQLWLADQLATGTGANNVFLAFRLTGELDPDMLEQAIAEVVRRHEALRTRFTVVDEQPVQLIEPPFRPRIERIDLPDAAAAADLDERTAAFVAEPFDVSVLPLLRVALLSGGGQRTLAFVLHHLIVDGWSLDRFCDEVGRRYADLKAGITTNPTDEVPAPQYADYALEQRDRVRSAAVAVHRAEQLADLEGIPTLLDLPFDRPRPARRDYAGGSLPFRIPAATARRVRELGRKHGVTPFMCLLAACELMLWRWAGQDRFLLGTLVANRTTVRAEGMLGHFVNTVVLPADLTDDPTFDQLLRRVRDRVPPALTRADVPFEQLVEQLSPDRSLGYHPVVQVLFTVHDTLTPRLRLPGAELDRLPIPETTSQFDLSVNLTPDSDGMAGELGYATELFDRVTIQRFAEQYLRVLEAVAADPARRISSIALLDAAEHAELDALGTGPVRTIDRTPVPGKARRIAELHPDRVAVQAADGSWTYAELLDRTRALAGMLSRAGVRRGSMVGVCLSRTRLLPAALLAVWAAGGAYLPLDPDYPPSRLAFMAADSGMAFLLTDDSVPVADAGLGLGEHVRVLRTADAPADADWPEHEPDPEDLAYLIYTSGSTGQPKGVPVEHASLANLLEAYVARDGVDSGSFARPVFGPDDRMLTLSSLSWDPLGRQLFLPIIVGGRTVIAEPTADPATLHDLVQRHGITHLSVTPATMRLYLEHLRVASHSGPPDSLRQLWCGSEDLPPDLAEAMLALGLPVFNGYGPTETTISTCWAPVEPDKPVSIGRPIANARVAVLDQQGRMVPRGVPGELVIGGAGVARGYHGRADLTVERFRRAPDGSRWYHTGDVVRWTNQDTLQFLGRRDDQVKIRGHRVELGEVNAAVRSLVDVQDCVTIADTDPVGGNRLVTYVIPAAGRIADPGTLRVEATDILPAHMVPSVWMVLGDRSGLPISANGKLDRAALPAPSESVRTDRSEPATRTERALAGIWSEVLGIPDIDRFDEFFAIGGHSLSGIRVVTRVRERLRVALDLRDLFGSPRLLDLAARIDQSRADDPAGNEDTHGAETPGTGLGSVDRSQYRITAPLDSHHP